MYQHAIDNFKLIAEIHVLASETFKTKLCWERSKKMLRVKKHRSASKRLHNCSNHCDVSFCSNDHFYMYLYFCMRWWLQLFCISYKFLKDEISFREIEISSRPNDISLISANFVCISFAQYCTWILGNLRLKFSCTQIKNWNLSTIKANVKGIMRLKLPFFQFYESIKFVLCSKRSNC